MKKCQRSHAHTFTAWTSQPTSRIHLHSFRMGIAFSALNDSLTRHWLRASENYTCIQQGVKYTYDVAKRDLYSMLFGVFFFFPRILRTQTNTNCVILELVENYCTCCRPSDRLIFHKFHFSACDTVAQNLVSVFDTMCGDRRINTSSIML